MNFLKSNEAWSQAKCWWKRQAVKANDAALDQRDPVLESWDRFRNPLERVSETLASFPKHRGKSAGMRKVLAKKGCEGTYAESKSRMRLLVQFLLDRIVRVYQPPCNEQNYSGPLAGYSVFSRIICFS